MTPDIVFRDPCLLDFVGLRGAFSEKDLETALVRELGDFILELAELQLDGDEAAQSPVVEKQVQVVVAAVDGDALLALDEGEPNAELQYEVAASRSLSLNAPRSPTKSSRYGSRKTMSGVIRSSDRRVASSCLASCSGLRESEVRSNNIPWIFVRSVLTFQLSTRHISA